MGGGGRALLKVSAVVSVYGMTSLMFQHRPGNDTIQSQCTLHNK